MANSRSDYQAEYKRQNYDRLSVLVPKGKGKIIKGIATAQGKSVSQLIVEMLESRYQLDLTKSDGE